MLHKNCKNKKFKDVIEPLDQPTKDARTKAFENMNEIAEYFSGNRNWGKANLDENYANWFRNVTNIIEGLDFKHSTKTGRKIQQLI